MVETPPPDENAMVRVAVADLEHQFDDVDAARIEQTVRKHLDKRFAHARVKTYVGIFAERDARAELRRAHAHGAGSDDEAVRGRRTA
jgi:hypothetical protein